MHTAERLITYAYYAFVSVILGLAIIGKLVWYYQVLVLGHYPQYQPRWRRSLKRWLQSYRASGRGCSGPNA
jgi:hypothetical protein